MRSSGRALRAGASRPTSRQTARTFVAAPAKPVAAPASTRSLSQSPAARAVGTKLGNLASRESVFAAQDTLTARHVGPTPADVEAMLSSLGYDSMDAFVADVVPEHIRIDPGTVTDATISPLSETEMLRRARELARKNVVATSFIGSGYQNAVVPPVILRNLLENPTWYTACVDAAQSMTEVSATRPTSPRSRRAGSSRCSTSRPSARR